MAYKVMQKDDDGVLREVVIRGNPVFGSDMAPGDIELKEFDDNTRSFLAIGSTGTSDRSADIIDQKGWELDNFNKNPVGMWVHDYRQLPIFLVRDMDIKTRAKKMYFKPHFDDHELADKVYRSYKKGFMRAFSVGFIPLDYERRDPEDMTDEEKTRAGWFGGRNFKRQELLEISAVPIPANQEALAGVKSMGIPVEWNDNTTRELGLIRSTLDDGSIWIPLKDTVRFVSINTAKIDDVKVVSGKLPEDSAHSNLIAEVIGYIFPKGYEDEKIAEWLVKHNIPKDKVDDLITTQEKEPMELEVDEDGKFELELAKAIEDIAEDETPDGDDEIQNDNVESTVDRSGDKFVIIPESIEIDKGELLIKANLGTCRISKETLEKAGLEIVDDQLVNVGNRQTLEEAANLLIALLGDVKVQEDKIEPEPEQTQDAQQDEVTEEEEVETDAGEVVEEESEDFALLLEVAEELKEEIDKDFEVDPEMFREVFGEVLKRELGVLVKSSVRENIKYVTGDLE